MKKLLILCISIVVLTSCLRKTETDDISGSVTITGRLTTSCDDSTIVSNYPLTVGDNGGNFYQKFYTDSLGRFSFTVPASIGLCDILKSSGSIYMGSFCMGSADIGTIFFNPCAKVVLHYDTSNHKLNLDQPFTIRVLDDDTLFKASVNELAKPDSIKLGKYSINHGKRIGARFYTKAKTVDSYFAPVNSVYTWQHLTVKVP